MIKSAQTKYPYFLNGKLYFFKEVWFYDDGDDQYMFLDPEGHVCFFNRSQLKDFICITSSYDLPKKC